MRYIEGGWPEIFSKILLLSSILLEKKFWNKISGFTSCTLNFRSAVTKKREYFYSWKKALNLSDVNEKNGFWKKVWCIKFYLQSGKLKKKILNFFPDICRSVSKFFQKIFFQNPLSLQKRKSPKSDFRGVVLDGPPSMIQNTWKMNILCVLFFPIWPTPNFSFSAWGH